MVRPTQEPALLTGNIEYLVLDSVSGDTTGFVIQQGNLSVSSSLTSNTKYFKDLQGLWQSANMHIVYRKES